MSKVPTNAQVIAAAKKIVAAAKKNPAKRIGTAKPKRKSQITGNPPTKRLVKRRKENKVPGYFPNPSEVVSAHKGSGKAHDVLPYIVATKLDKPIANFAGQKEAEIFARDYAKRHNVAVKLLLA